MGTTRQAATIARGGSRCAHCARPLSPPAQDGGTRDDAATIDHIDGNGGNHEASNIVPACRSCNNLRRWPDLFEAHLRSRGETVERAEARVREQTSAPLDFDAGRALANDWNPERVRRCAEYRARYQLRRAGILPALSLTFP